MRLRLGIWTGLAVLSALFCRPATAGADLIKLDSGGELRGRITKKFQRDGLRLVRMETLTGTVVTVERRHTRFVTRRPMKVEHYETRAKQTPQTVAAQWQLAQWCRQQRLKRQRDKHLWRILELDPDHEQAHRALGHIRHEGRWTTRDELMRSQGYVKHKGRYITPQELELLKKSQADLQAERNWYKKIHLWHTWLTGDRPDRQNLAVQKLRTVRDPHAIAALVNFLQDDADERVRALFVDILAHIGGPPSIEPLVQQSLYDVDRGIRSRALDALPDTQQQQAIPLYEDALQDDSNRVVRRAASALKEVGDTGAVPALIDALVTTHSYRVRVQDNSNMMSFSSDGSFALGGSSRPVPLPPQIEVMLRAGQLPHGVIVHQPHKPRMTRVVRIEREHQNQEVLAALRELTGQNFGFDERTWRLWWNAEKEAIN